YGVLEKNTTKGPEQESYSRLKHIEEKHVAAWEGLLKENKVTGYGKQPSVKAKLMAVSVKSAGTGWLREMMLREEGNEVKSYLQLYGRSTDPATRHIAITLAKDSAGHAQSLNELTGR